MCQRGNCPFSNLKIWKVYKLLAFLKTLQRLKQEWQNSLDCDQANRRQKLGLVWRNRKKISQITNASFYLPFFLLIILWLLVIIFWRCGKCDKAFPQAAELRAHEYTHAERKLYECDLCGKGFSRPDGLRAHVKVCMLYLLKLFKIGIFKEILNRWLFIDLEELCCFFKGMMQQLQVPTLRLGIFGVWFKVQFFFHILQNRLEWGGESV